jgi:hypothetical protein
MRWLLFFSIFSFAMVLILIFRGESKSIEKMHYMGVVVQVEYLDIESRVSDPVSGGGFINVHKDETYFTTSKDFIICVEGKIRVRKRIAMYRSGDWICFGKDKAVCFSICYC